MKRTILIGTSIALFIVFLFVVINLRLAYVDYKAKQKRIQKQQGVYKLDIEKTNLNAYIIDTNIYKDLTLTFTPSKKFYLNMDVPFIYDSLGLWEPGGAGVEDWNYLIFERNKDIKVQVGQCCTNDSTITLNSVTPKQGKPPVHKIILKKLNPKEGDMDW